MGSHVQLLSYEFPASRQMTNQGYTPQYIEVAMGLQPRRPELSMDWLMFIASQTKAPS